MNNEISTVIGSAIVIIASVIIFLKKNGLIFTKHNIEAQLSRCEKNIAINSLITDICYAYHCSNVLVLQFHNGTNFFSGRGIERMMATHERVGKGGTTLSHHAQGILSTPYSTLLGDLLKTGECIQEHEDDKWDNIMPPKIDYSVNVACVANNKMIGYIKLCWHEKPSDLDIEQLVLAVKNKGVVEFLK